VPRMGFRESFALLIVLTVASWGIPAFELAYYGSASVLSMVTALMLTTMLGVWPFLTGKRVAKTPEGVHVERAMMCVECKSLSWPAEQAMTFCLRCGSTKTAVPAGA
jgi:hypothetical protein